MATVKTIKPAGGGDFTTLAAWESFADGEATADQHAECFTGGDLGIVSLSGWTAVPTSTVFPKIFASAGEEHGGDETVGCFISVVDNATGIDFLDDLPFFQIVDIRIKMSGTTGNAIGVRQPGVAGRTFKGCLFDSLLIHSTKTGGTAKGIIIGAKDITWSLADAPQVRNCLIFPESGAIMTRGMEINAEAVGGSEVVDINYKLYNNSVVGDTDGIFFNVFGLAGGDSTLRVTTNNNISFPDVALSAIFSGRTFVSTSSNNATGDGTADSILGGSNNLINQTDTDIWTDPTTPVFDFTLKKPTSNAIGAGIELSSVFTTDIKGVSFDISAWDMGSFSTFVTEAILSGSGTITAEGSFNKAVLSGTGTISATPNLTLGGDATLLGAGTIAAAGVLTLGASATLSGSGTVNALGGLILGASATLSGTGTVVAVGQDFDLASATLVGTGTVVATAVLTLAGRSTLSGTGTVVATAVLTLAGNATLGGTGTVVADGGRIRVGQATLSGTGTINGIAGFFRFGEGNLSGTGTVTAVGQDFDFATATLSGTGTVTADGGVAIIATATLSGTGTIVASGTELFAGVANLLGDGTIVALVTTRSIAILSGTGTLTAIGSLVRLGTASLSGTGTMVATAATATDIWDSAGSSSWDTDGNWQDGTKPDAGTAVQFDSTSTVNCTLDVNVNVKNLTFASAYNGTFDGDTFDMFVLNNIDIAGSSLDLLGGSGTWDIDGSVRIRGASFDPESSDWNIGNDVIAFGTNSVTKGTGTITLNGLPDADAHEINFRGNDISDLVIDADSGTKRLISSAFTADSITINSGILETNGLNMALASPGTLVNAGTVSMRGTETATNITIDNTQGKVIYDNSNALSVFPLGNSYFDLTFA